MACGFSNAQTCAYGTSSNTTGIGENISTGGAFEYKGATDFDVPFGTNFTVRSVAFNLLAEADVTLANVTFRSEQNGMPGDPIGYFPALNPTSQVLLYEIPEIGMNCYTITVELPAGVTLEKGKYFLDLSAMSADGTSVWWEIASESQTYGLFDYNKFEDEDWGGTGYYSKVFQVIGDCEDSGEVQPEYGDACMQENAFESFQVAATFMNSEGMVPVADDFTVAPNTTFYLTKFTMHTILLGGGLHNATINIRSSVDGAPGEILHAFEQKGPSVEKYNGYWPFPGIPFDIVSVPITFSFESDPIMLTPGNYFIEVIPTPYATDLLGWLGTTQPGIGNYSFSSFDGGATWEEHQGLNMVMSVEGFCSESLGTQTPEMRSDLRYYPNPVRDVLTIDREQSVNRIAIYNMEGREVSGYRALGNSIDMQHLATGVYIVKVMYKDGSSDVLKIAKQ